MSPLLIFGKLYEALLLPQKISGYAGDMSVLKY
jgi:hypothetical protein